MTLRYAALLLPLWLAAPAFTGLRSEQPLDLLSNVPAGLIESDLGTWSTMWFVDFEAAADTLEALRADADADQLALRDP